MWYNRDESKKTKGVEYVWSEMNYNKNEKFYYDYEDETWTLADYYRYINYKEDTEEPYES